MNPIVILSTIFDYLVREFNEDPANLPLFIQNFTAESCAPWSIISKEKGPVGFLRIGPNTGTFEFYKVENQSTHQTNLNTILLKFKRKKEEKDADAVEKIKQQITSSKRELKSGDIIEFGASNSEWRDITPVDPIAQYHKSPGFIGLNPDGSLTKPWAGKLGDG